MDQKVQAQVQELNVLNTFHVAIEQGSPCDANLIRPIFEDLKPSDHESFVRSVAMAFCLGIPLHPISLSPEEVPTDSAGALFHRVSKAWILWAMGLSAEAHRALHDPEKDGPSPGSEIHRMALGPFCRAVAELLKGDLPEARRFFLRSLDIGSQFGTETSLAIQWIYVATFFIPTVPTITPPR